MNSQANNKFTRLISIVVVTYNSSSKIETLLKSLFRDDKIINEVIIIENHSPDREITKDIINKYVKQFSFSLKYVEMDNNYGFAYSCNYGAKLSHSPYVLFLNPDTEIKRNSISILLDHMLKHGANIAGGKVISYNDTVHRTVVHSPNFLIGLFEFTNLGKLLNTNLGSKLFYYNIDNIKSDTFVQAIGGAFLLVDKDSFFQLNGFDDKFFMYLEDVDFGIRAEQKGMKILFCPHSEILHVGGASSKNKFKIRHDAWFSSRSYFFRKHGTVCSNIILQPLFYIEQKLLLARLKLKASR